MKVSIIGKRYGKETAALIAMPEAPAKEVILGIPRDDTADFWVITDWDPALQADWKNGVRPSDIVILNDDDKGLLRHMAGLLCNTVTFGYHLKSTVTLSGTEEDVTSGNLTYTFALQRSMLTKGGRLLEPCEWKWSTPAQVASPVAMAAGAFFLAADVAFFS